MVLDVPLNTNGKAGLAQSPHPEHTFASLPLLTCSCHSPCPGCPALSFHSPADIYPSFKHSLIYILAPHEASPADPDPEALFQTLSFSSTHLTLTCGLLVGGCVAGSRTQAHSSTCKYFLSFVLGTVLDQWLDRLFVTLLELSDFQPGDQGKNTTPSSACVRDPDMGKDFSKPCTCLAPASAPRGCDTYASHLQLLVSSGPTHCPK